MRAIFNLIFVLENNLRNLSWETFGDLIFFTLCFSACWKVYYTIGYLVLEFCSHCSQEVLPRSTDENQNCQSYPNLTAYSISDG